ncbi:MAG TPA: nucleotidyltransferase family protein [Candidatus Saccharimonadales bacterium]|nr:nucleotidyltransferase family protein [Candidatus Saccharimonadales bacterium]
MRITSEAEIEKLVKSDLWMMQVLEAAESLQLRDWWIGAGFLRNRIWDAVEGNETQPPKDVDLVYFNADDIAPETDWAYDETMKQQYPEVEWEIRNQARMHYVNDFKPYTSTADGISHWVETATCVAVKLENGKLKFLFCYGTDDLLGLVARPTPYFTGDLLATFHERVEKKQWRKRWPHLQVKNK